MGNDKGKVLLLVVLLLALYGIVYYRFIWTDKFFPDIEEVNAQIETATKKKEALENDKKNIDALKRNLKMKTIQDDRLEAYLLNESNVTDGIEYIDKLAKLFNNNIFNAEISRPEEKTIEETKGKFYEFKIDFEALMSYRKAMDLINYLEGGSRKVKISRFEIKPQDNLKAKKPQSQQNQQTPQSTPNPQNTSPQPTSTPEEIYSIGMTVNLYSLNIGNIDKMYDYSRQRFNRYFEGDTVVFDKSGLAINTGVATGEGSGTTSGGSSPDGSGNVAVAFEEDLGIYIESFLVGGQNFFVYCNETNNKINFKTRITPKVKMTFNGDTVDIDVVGNGGDQYNIKGRVTGDVINLSVLTNYSLNINENKDLGVNLQIVNNTNKKITVKLNDKVRRAKLTDRNGNGIYKNSATEKLDII